MGSTMITHYGGLADLQRPFDAAVVIPTICRPSLVAAVRSVFRQTGVERIQVVIGIDVASGDRAVIDTVLSERPAQHAVTVLDLGYSLAMRHGGLHPENSGGPLRTVLSYVANSRFIAYLDDDNWYAETHIARLRSTIEGYDWAYSLRWLVDPTTLQPLCVDIWESIGPGRGVFLEGYGGFVDTGCFMIDKTRCGPALHHWSTALPGDSRRRGSDRMVFDYLHRNHSFACSGSATTFYVMNPSDAAHDLRMARIKGWLATRGARRGMPP